jgi:hypothetical protein
MQIHISNSIYGEYCTILQYIAYRYKIRQPTINILEIVDKNKQRSKQTSADLKSPLNFTLWTLLLWFSRQTVMCFASVLLFVILDDTTDTAMQSNILIVLASYYFLKCAKNINHCMIAYIHLLPDISRYLKWSETYATERKNLTSNTGSWSFVLTLTVGHVTEDNLRSSWSACWC